MKANFALVVTLANTVLAGPLVNRDEASDLTALTSTVKVHTANINQTLATLPPANATVAGNSSNPNITAEFNLIAQALNSSSETLGNAKRSLPLWGRQDAVACDATCQVATYNDLGALTAELAYTMAACINKNTVDLTSSSSVLISVVEALGDVTSNLQDSVAGIAGIVVQTLQVAMGTYIGGALSTFISP